MSLLGRSTRTLAWLGDAFFEREVRVRVASRGDYPIDRLDAIKAAVVCAESQAAMLAALEPELTEAELAVVRRAKNRAPPGSSGRRGTREYRSATGLEALVALWELGDGRARMDAVLVPLIESGIDAAVVRLRHRLRRG